MLAVALQNVAVAAASARLCSATSSSASVVHAGAPVGHAAGDVCVYMLLHWHLGSVGFKVNVYSGPT